MTTETLQPASIEPPQQGGGDVRYDINRPEQDPALAGLPIEVVGQSNPLEPDRSKGFPHILYHGTKSENFVFDDTRDHRKSSIGTGARSGRGLYAASAEVAEQFGADTGLVELVPHEARLLDLGSPEAVNPLQQDFKDAYKQDFSDHAVERVQEAFSDIESASLDNLWELFAQTEGFIDKADVIELAKNKGLSDRRTIAAAREIASQINTLRAVDTLEDVSLIELFGAADRINGDSRVPVDAYMTLSPLCDFLTSKGVDGAITKQTFNAGDHQEPGVVFWKLDRLGDRETWERRAAVMPHELGKSALEAVPVALEADRAANLLEIFDGSAQLSAQEAESIAMIVNNKNQLVPKGSLDEVFSALAGSEAIDPTKLVAQLGSASPELTALLRAETGVFEGYRLHEHTQAVVGQFERFVRDRIEDPKLRQVLRTALVLQDIGKTLAVARTADKDKQTQYNKRVAATILESVDESVLSAEDKQLITALIGQDVVGQYLQGKVDLATAQSGYKKLEQTIPQKYKGKLKQLVQVMYICDSSAYSSVATYKDAHGVEKRTKGSLNPLFDLTDPSRIRLKSPRREHALAVFAAAA